MGERDMRDLRGRGEMGRGGGEMAERGWKEEGKPGRGGREVRGWGEDIGGREMKGWGGRERELVRMRPLPKWMEKLPGNRRRGGRSGIGSGGGNGWERETLFRKKLDNSLL